MSDLIFDPPLYLPAVFVLVAGVLLYSANARQRRGLLVAGVAAASVAVAIFVAGRLVETDREKVLRETRELAAAFDARDWPAFGKRLDPKVRFAMYKSRDDLVRGATRTADAVGVKNVTLGASHAEPEPGGFVVTFTATADIGDTGRRLPTDWKLYWAKGEGADAGTFQVYRIEPLPNARFGTEPITTRLLPP